MYVFLYRRRERGKERKDSLKRKEERQGKRAKGEGGSRQDLQESGRQVGM